jgi:hypothetical protein
MARKEDAAMGLLTHFFHRVFQACAIADGVAWAWWTERSQLAVRQIAAQHTNASA